MTDIAALPPPPPPGAAVPLLPGLLWARFPLPFPPSHVNVWLLAHDGGWLAIDTGVVSARTKGMWEELLECPALDGRPLTALLITHFHPDHIGLCGWLAERCGLTPMMTRIEWLQARSLWHDSGPEMMARQIAFYRRQGCSTEYCDFVQQRGPLYARAVAPLPGAFQAIKDGQELRIGNAGWRVITGAGHAPDMACLYSAAHGALISADQILPHISPYVGLHAGEPAGDPLGDFLASNERFRPLPEDTLVLPSHGDPFYGLQGRIDWLANHHKGRLDKLLGALAAPLTPLEAAGVLFPRAVPEMTQLGFALGETLAHLRRLEAMGEAVALPDEDVLRYRRR